MVLIAHLGLALVASQSNGLDCSSRVSSGCMMKESGYSGGNSIVVAKKGALLEHYDLFTVILLFAGLCGRY